MNVNNNSMGAKTRNINVGKAECSVVLTGQGAKDDNLLGRLLSEEVSIEPVTLTDALEELDGHDVALKQGWVQGVRIAVRPTQKKTTKATAKKVSDKAD